jgi:hypothetical protein
MSTRPEPHALNEDGAFALHRNGKIVKLKISKKFDFNEPGSPQKVCLCFFGIFYTVGQIAHL